MANHTCIKRLGCRLVLPHFFGMVYQLLLGQKLPLACLDMVLAGVLKTLSVLPLNPMQGDSMAWHNQIGEAVALDFSKM
jgi:hypothetical protein